MEIKSISEKIFKISSNKAENNSNHTNPFGVSFKGNIINADVFEDKNSNLTENQNKGKMLVSTLVGSMNSIHSAIGRRLNSVVSFGRRMKETTSNLWDNANNLWNKANNISMSDFLTTSTLAFTGAYSVKRLQERPVSDLKDLFEEKLSNMEAA